MTRKIKFSVVFSLSLCCLSLASVVAQEARQPSSGYVLVSLLQGEEIAFPEHYIAPLANGNLDVTLESLGLSQYNGDDVYVSLIQEDGTRIEQRPDANGKLTFPNVKEGLAALVVASGFLKSTYAATALYATPTVNDGRGSSPFKIPLATFDSTLVRSSVASAGEAPKGPSLRRLSEFPKRVVVNRFQVYLQADGSMKGRVVVPEAGFESSAGSVNLSFFRNGVLAGRATSAVDGTFTVPGLLLGVHSVLASGPPGHAAFAFEVMPPKLVDELPPVLTSVDEKRSKLVATKIQPVVAVPADELIVLIIPPTLMPGVREAVESAYPAAPVEMAGSAPFSSPGMSAPGGGGMGSGGGGAGAGGGFGGLLGIAGLAAGLAALSDNDDSFNANLATLIAPQD